MNWLFYNLLKSSCIRWREQKEHPQQHKKCRFPMFSVLPDHAVEEKLWKKWPHLWRPSIIKLSSVCCTWKVEGLVKGTAKYLEMHQFYVFSSQSLSGKDMKSQWWIETVFLSVASYVLPRMQVFFFMRLWSSHLRAATQLNPSRYCFSFKHFDWGKQTADLKVECQTFLHHMMRHLGCGSWGIWIKMGQHCKKPTGLHFLHLEISQDSYF